MSGRISMLVPVLALAVTAGCKQKYAEMEPANLVISSEFVEFGEIAQGTAVSRTITLSNTGQVPLGISAVFLATTEDAERGHPDSFRIDWDADDIAGGDSTEAEASAEREEVEANADSAIDTGDDEPGDTDPVDTDGDTDGGGSNIAFSLGFNERIPITITFSPKFPQDNYDAVIVQTADATAEESASGVQIYRDPDETWQQVYLHGTGEETAANMVVSPKDIDFGFVWTGQSETRYVAVKNVGDGPLTINNVKFKGTDGACDDFAMTFAPAPGTIVEGDSASVIEVVYTPSEVDEALCTILVSSDDLDAPEQEVSLNANRGTNATNRSPYVKIIQPTSGYQHQGWGPIEMEIVVNDPDQPAESLACSVTSSLQTGAKLTSCVPTNESGHFWVSVPIVDILESGLDVLTVSAVDDSNVRRRDSITVLINSGFPDGDDDGDGFELVSADPELIPNDCDDNNGATYPFAAEIYDGKDNDCDFRADEGTDGADDDGDGMSEVAGDCDDNNKNTYRGAPERQDTADNDCDGIIDEQTSAFDDDGDGFAELDLDCDDNDPAVNPAVIEICGDGHDNNCNGFKDSQEPCISNDSKPMLVGRINLGKTATEVNGSVQISAFIFEADGDLVNHQWDVREGEGTIDEPASPGITWTAPATVPPSTSDDGAIIRLSYIGADDDDNQVWAFAEVSLYNLGGVNRNILVPQN